MIYIPVYETLSTRTAARVNASFLFYCVTTQVYKHLPIIEPKTITSQRFLRVINIYEQTPVYL